MDQERNFRGVPAMPRDFGFHVAGTWREPGGRPMLARESPGYGVPVTRVTLCTRADVDEAVAVAREAFAKKTWSGIAGRDRAAVLLRVARGIRARVEELAYWETLETGKPISQSLSEMHGAAGHYEYAAGVAQTLRGDAFNNLGEDMFGVVTREPVGVVGLITPWNFPFIVLSERIPYILASGNSVVVKPSEMTSATTLLVADILNEAGLPNGVYNVVTGLGPEVGQAITEHRGIDMVSFTGSTRVGGSVLAASTKNFKKVSLELGGKNPQIVFADADLEDAADGIAYGLCFNAGQCCVSGSRLIVEASVADEFRRLVEEKFGRVRTGECLAAETQLGAIVSEQHCNKILNYIRLGLEAGAERGLRRGYARHRRRTLHCADAANRRPQRHAGRPRRNLWTGAVHDDLQRRGRGAPARQRHVPRACGQHLDEEHRQSHSSHAWRAGRANLGQYDHKRWPGVAFRRLQAIRHRARRRRHRRRRIHRGEVHPHRSRQTQAVDFLRKAPSVAA